MPQNFGFQGIDPRRTRPQNGTSQAQTKKSRTYHMMSATYMPQMNK